MSQIQPTIGLSGIPGPCCRRYVVKMRDAMTLAIDPGVISLKTGTTRMTGRVPAENVHHFIKITNLTSPGCIPHSHSPARSTAICRRSASVGSLPVAALKAAATSSRAKTKQSSNASRKSK